MIRFFRHLYPLLDRETRIRFVVAGLLMIVLAGLEAGALLALIPLMQILTASNLQPNSRLVNVATDLLGPSSPTHLALRLGLLTITLYVVKSVVAILVMRWTATFALEHEARNVQRLMDLYLHASYRLHLGRNSNELVRTLTYDVRQALGIAFVQAFSAAGDLFSVLFVGIILISANPALAVVAGLYFVCVSVGYQRVVRNLHESAARRLQVAQAEDLQTVSQALAAIKEIKVRGVEDHFSAEVFRLRQTLVGPYRIFELANVTPRYVLELAMTGAAAVIAAFTYSTESLNAATATVGIFLAGGFRMLAPLNKVMFGITKAKAAMPSLEQMKRDLETYQPDESPAVPAVAPPPHVDLEPRIILRDVTFSYVPGVPVIKGVNLEINPGESVGLVGGSGAGKSTLLDILLGLLSPDGGEVLIDGWDIRTVRDDWQRIIGYVPQSIALFDDSIRANVMMGLPSTAAADDRVWEVLRLAQLDDAVRSLPDALDTRIGERGTRLSGGQRQRLGVARSLYPEPKVLMFDEATSALDNETEFRLTEVLDSLHGQLTTITIAHRLSTVRRCDQVFYLDHGMVTAKGSFESLTATVPGFARLVELAALTA